MQIKSSVAVKDQNTKCKIWHYKRFGNSQKYVWNGQPQGCVVARNARNFHRIFQGELFTFEIDLANKQDNIDGGVLLFVVNNIFTPASHQGYN